MISPQLTSAPPPTILIVDDDPVFRSLTRDALTDTGLSVIEAADGREAVRYCSEAEPSLLVVDAMMPNMDGFALCRELRERDATRHTPILMVTGLHDHGALECAYKAGATDFAVKPIEWGNLAQRVRYILRNAGTLADLREALTEVEESPKKWSRSRRKAGARPAGRLARAPRPHRRNRRRRVRCRS